MANFPVSFLSSSRMNTRFDEVFNIEGAPRFSEQGFQDPERMMAKPRSGTETLAVLPEGGLGDVGKLTWFTSDEGIKYGFISKGGDLYKCLHRRVGKYLGKFEMLVDAGVLAVGDDGDYFIVHETLYVFNNGISAALDFLWTDNYDNEADLFAIYPVPEDDVFAFLKDSQSVYYSEGGRWIPYAENYEFELIALGNNAEYPAFFNSISAPSDWQIDGLTPGAATAVEAVRVPVAMEATATTYVGSYLVLTSGTYKGKYSYIFNYDATNKQFITLSLGNATNIASGVDFKIFSKKGRYLQITNGKDTDKYYSGTAFNTYFEGLVKQHIEKFATFPDGGPGIMSTYGSQSFTAIGDSVFISDVSQPFWFNINDSIDLQKNSGVDDYFRWKNRMIAYGSNFTTFINPSVSSGAERTYDFKNYGIVPGSCAEVLDDFWFLSYSGQIIPLSEALNGTLYEKKNIGLPVTRYIREMRTNVTACFDGIRYYIYGESKNEAGYTCVYDTTYNFWAVYTGIRPKHFVVDEGIVYFVEHTTGKLKKFLRDKVTDSEIPEDQYISSRDIDGGYSFLLKALEYSDIFVENQNQQFDLKISWRTHGDSFSKTFPNVVNKKEATEDDMVMGYNNVDFSELVPQFIHHQLDNDFANIWKWEIRNTGTNGFYLNQIDLGFNVNPEKSQNIDL